MSNNTEVRMFAYEKSPKWDLPPSEDKDAVEKTTQAIGEYANHIRKAVGNDGGVDWVIM